MNTDFDPEECPLCHAYGVHVCGPDDSFTEGQGDSPSPEIESHDHEG